MSIILNQTRQERVKENIVSYLHHSKNSGVAIASADSDHGVIQNGGRLGARWAAKAILAQFKKMAAPQNCPYVFIESLCTQEDPFLNARLKQIEKLKELIKGSHRLLHLGGGHDHVYSLLKSFDSPVLVINIDAHLDTRADAWSHSGNPFREFDLQTKNEFDLFQIGIHPFANSLSTQQALSNGKMHILERKNCDHKGEVLAFWNKIYSRLSPQTQIIFSIDADALAVDALKAVSAPNHRGLSIDFLMQQMDLYKELCHQRAQKQIWGLYEFNPLYDDLSGTSARVAAGLIYEMLLS